MPQPRCHQCNKVLPKERGNYCTFAGSFSIPMPPYPGLRSRRWVTVLFADIVGFTSLSEHHEPDEIGALLDNILEPLTSIILEENGLLINISATPLWLFSGPTLPHTMMPAMRLPPRFECKKRSRNSLIISKRNMGSVFNFALASIPAKF